MGEKCRNEKGDNNMVHIIKSVIGYDGAVCFHDISENLKNPYGPIWIENDGTMLFTTSNKNIVTDWHFVFCAIDVGDI